MIIHLQAYISKKPYIPWMQPTLSQLADCQSQKKHTPACHCTCLPFHLYYIQQCPCLCRACEQSAPALRGGTLQQLQALILRACKCRKAPPRRAKTNGLHTLYRCGHGCSYSSASDIYLATVIAFACNVLSASFELSLLSLFCLMILYFVRSF